MTRKNPLSRILDSIAALAASAPGQRTGVNTPGSAPALASAPAPGVRQAQRTSPQRLRRSLRFSSLEGIVAEAFTSFAGGAVLTGWGIHLGCTPLVLGMLGAMPFVAQFAQLPAAWLTSRFGRRRVAIVSVCLSRQVLLPLVAIPFLPMSIASRQHLLIGVAACSAILAVVGNNAWVAWMGDLVPSTLRGRYFGKRTALCTLGGTLASLLAGMALDGARTPLNSGTALAGLALAACVVGAVTTWLMSQQHDSGAEEDRFELSAALTPFRHRPARRFLAYQVAWNGAVGISGAYYGVYMLQGLKMGFVLMALHGAATATARICGAPLWGRALDRFGARPVLLACSSGIVLLPLVWLFPTSERLWPLGIDAMLSGFLWGGHSVAAFALPLSLAPRRGRPLYLAAFATAGGLSQGASTWLGGMILTSLPATMLLGGHALVPFHVLIVTSSSARFLAAILGRRIVEEGSRPVEELLQSGVDEAQQWGAELPKRLLSKRTPTPKSGPAPRKTG